MVLMITVCEQRCFPYRRRFPVSCGCCLARWCSFRRFWLRRGEEIPLSHVRPSHTDQAFHMHPQCFPLLLHSKPLTCLCKQSVSRKSSFTDKQNMKKYNLLFYSCRCFFNVTRQKAEQMLEEKPNYGSIIIRPSTLANNFAVTLRLQMPRSDDPRNL